MKSIMTVISGFLVVDFVQMCVVVFSFLFSSAQSKKKIHNMKQLSEFVYKVNIYILKLNVYQRMNTKKKKKKKKRQTIYAHVVIYCIHSCSHTYHSVSYKSVSNYDAIKKIHQNYLFISLKNSNKRWTGVPSYRSFSLFYIIFV